MIKRFVFCSMILASVSGCVSGSLANKDSNGYKMKNPDPIAERLIEASNDAAQSIRVLARVNNAKSMKNLTTQQMAQDAWQNENVPKALNQRVDIDRWSGPPATIISNLSKYAGWKFAIAGKPPTPTPLVNIIGENKRIVDYLYDIGYQLGDKADIIVTPASHGSLGVIKLQYKTKKLQTANEWHGN